MGAIPVFQRIEGRRLRLVKRQVELGESIEPLKRVLRGLALCPVDSAPVAFKFFQLGNDVLGKLLARHPFR
jgi:hypothetical protein